MANVPHTTGTLFRLVCVQFPAVLIALHRHCSIIHDWEQLSFVRPMLHILLLSSIWGKFPTCQISLNHKINMLPFDKMNRNAWSPVISFSPSLTPNFIKSAAVLRISVLWQLLLAVELIGEVSLSYSSESSQWIGNLIPSVCSYPQKSRHAEGNGTVSPVNVWFLGLCTAKLTSF